VTLTARPGETIAIVGHSVAGKTSLVSLLPRFYAASEGTIFVDGHDVSQVTVESLRRSMAIVPQEAILFGGTVRENIAYGREGATDEEIEMATRAANAHQFVTRSFDQELETIAEPNSA
jgi:ABC-type multidrug transport system fused ATPase/permease subunit